MSKPSLELTASIGGPSGRRWRYAPAARDAGDRPLDLSFSTEAGEGFGTGRLTLARPYDQDSPDLSLLGDVVIEGYDGQIAYEGRVRGTPRSLSGQGPQIRMDLEGWMSAARSQPFTDLLIDRDTSSWQPIATTRKIDLYNGGWKTITDGTTGEGVNNTPAVLLTNPANAVSAISGIRYIPPPGATVAFYAYAIQKIGVSTPSLYGTGGLAVPSGVSTGVGTQQTGRAAEVSLILGRDGLGNVGGADESASVESLAMVGTAAQDIVSDGVPPQVLLSEAIRYLLGRYAPQLDLSQMVNNGFPVAHAVWREPVTCHDAIRELNAYSQWALGVYENRQVEYRPFDLTRWDWEVRAGQDGVEVETQGVTTEAAFNGVVVTYQDWAGQPQVITPDQATDLQDLNPAIAANQWGNRQWTQLNLSRMTSREGAITQARLYLADLNRPTFPSTITVPGHIKDRQGNWQPAWRVRANQTISIRNHPNDAPRLITSTAWQGNQLQITTDNALNRFEAITARLDRARADKGM